MKIADAALNILNEAINLLNVAAPPVLTRLGWACLAGGTLTLLVWVVCTLLRLPAKVRVWFWWLVGMKYPLGLLPTVAALALTFSLPRNTVPEPVLHPLTALAKPFTHPSRPVTHHRQTARITPEAAIEEPLTTHPTNVSPVKASLSLPGLLLLAYIVGVLVMLGRFIAGWLKVCRIVQRAHPLFSDDLEKMCNECATLLGLHRFPALYESSDITTPLVTGLLKPLILLPAGFVDKMPPAMIRPVLLHEMVHIQRGDLFLGLLTPVVHLLFWWFPLATIACREWEQAREECCDAVAVNACRIAPLTYGKLLMLLATGSSPSAANTAAMASPGFTPLKRRLTTLRQKQAPLSRAKQLLIALILLAIGASILPYRVRATVPLPEPLVELAIATPRYEVIPLGTLGGEYSDAYAVNDYGLTVGTASLPERQGRGHAFLSSATDELRDLSADSDYTHSIACSINNSGSVAANAFYRVDKPQAFFWDGKRHYIGTLPGFGYSRAIGINDGGAVVGNALRFRRQWGAVQARAFLWNPASGMRDLGTLGGPYSHASAINSRGQVTGKADLIAGSETQTHAFLWDSATGMHDLGTLGGVNSRAHAINDNGEVVGVSETTDGKRKAFISTNAAMHPLADYPGAIECSANAINANGLIVGSATVSEDDSHALLWQHDIGATNDRVIDLNICIAPDSGWKLLTARGINARGEIVGQGTWQGKHLAFLLRPVN